MIELRSLSWCLISAAVLTVVLICSPSDIWSVIAIDVGLLFVVIGYRSSKHDLRKPLGEHFA